MKRIILTSLFFCLSITTILAQVVTTNIVAPDSNGLSTNSVADFDVNSDGTILNNSAASGTATLGSTAVTGNGNITTGSEADLILFQVTGTSGSDLDGTIEVFGGEAGVIIANPNGIECDGCAFTNVNRVDLVTGSGYDADTNTFSTIAATDIDITSSGLTAPVLKIQTGADFNNAGAIVADTVTIDVTNFANDIANTGTVSATSLNIIFTDDLYSTATAFNKFSFNNLAITAGGYFISRSAFNLDNLTIKTGGNFENRVTINADSITVTADGNFTNGARINTASLTVTTNSFENRANSTINADRFTVLVDDFYSNIGSVINATNFTLSVAGNLTTVATSTIDADSLTLTTNSFANSGVVSADALTVSVAGDFDYEGTITANAFNLQVGGDFSYNDSANDFVWGDSDILTVSGNANITAADFTNRGTITVTNNNAIDLAGNLTITANRFINYNNVTAADNLSVVVSNHFTNSASTLKADNVDIQVTGYILNSANAIIEATDNLNIVTGTLFNVAAGAKVSNGNVGGNIIAANLTIETDKFNNINNDGDINGNITANTFALSVAEDFDYSSDYLNNGNITTNNALNLNVGGDFSNNDASSDFTWGATDTLTVSGNADITTDNYTQSGTITVDGVWTINALTDFTYSNANNDFIWDTNDSLVVSGNAEITTNNFANGGTISADTLALSVAGDFDYLADYLGNGSITTNTINLQVGGDFSYNDSASDFTWGATDILTVSGNADITTNNYTQSGAITVDGVWTINALTDFTYSNTNNDFIWDTNDSLVVSGNADITTNNYTQAGAINVAGDLTVNANNYTYDNTSSDFVLATNDSLSISGDFTIATNHYIQFGTLEVDGTLAIDAESNFVNSGAITTESLNITAGYTAINQGSIVSGSLDVITADFFRNLTGGDIAVDNLNIVAGGKVTNTANITVGTLTITANNNSSRDNDTTGFYVSNRGNIIATSLNIAAVDNFYNRGNITATNFNITRAKSVFFLNKEIDSFYAAGHTYDGGNISLSGNSSFRADAGSIENYGNIDLGDNILDISADNFTNHEDATIDAATVNLINVNRFIDNGSITATVNQ